MKVQNLVCKESVTTCVALVNQLFGSPILKDEAVKLILCVCVIKLFCMLLY